MSARASHRRLRLALAGALAALAGAGALSGCALTGGTGAEPAGAAVQTIDGRGETTIPSQGLNGPALPAGPKPVPLAVGLDRVIDPVKVPFDKPPTAGLVYDLDTGEVLWRRNATRVLPMASVTKMMTALLVDERLPPGSRVRITKQAVDTGGSKVGVLPLHKQIGVQTMLYGLLLPSGNDAAVALAQRVSGTTKRFVALMNARAKSMHLSCTHFASPSGLVDRHNHTCAYDLAALSRAFLDRPRLAGIVKRKQAILPFPIKGGKLYLYSHEPLVKQDYPGALGIKTGFTDAAGHCVVGAAEQGGHRLGVILLHSPDITVQSIKLLDRAFAYEQKRDR